MPERHTQANPSGRRFVHERGGLGAPLLGPCARGACGKGSVKRAPGRRVVEAGHPTPDAEIAMRCVHYVGFRDDRYWNAYRIFGGPRIIHRRWDRFAKSDVGPEDVVVFAQGDETQPLARYNATDIVEREA